METQKPRATFSKEERLTGHKTIQGLMEHGSSISVPPLQLVWQRLPAAGKFPARIAFAVSKKKFPLAVDRNRIKRQMREMYRKNKFSLYSFLREKELQVVFMLIYTRKEKPLYPDLEKKYHLVIRQLEERLS